MPRAKKKPGELTTEEALKKLFPKKARDKVKADAEKWVPPAKISIKKKHKG